jgi:hypothetical protein
MFGQSSNRISSSTRIGVRQSPDYFLPALTFAHLAFWAAAIFLRPAADILRLGLAVSV